MVQQAKAVAGRVGERVAGRWTEKQVKRDRDRKRVGGRETEKGKSALVKHENEEFSFSRLFFSPLLAARILPSAI